MLRIGVLVSGGGTNLQAIIDAIEDKSLEAEIVLVISSKRSAYALERAKKHGAEGMFISKKACADDTEYSERLAAAFGERKADVIVTAGFLTVLPESFVRRYENRIINIHCSLIPAFAGTGFYGLRVHEAALRRGVKVSGATVHFVSEITDGGPIILQKAVDVLPGDTPETLQIRVMQEAEWLILPEALRLIAAGRVRVENGKAVIS